MTARIRLLLRDLRQERELSQEELAQALNISRQSIISLERGEYLPSSPVLLSLLEFFNCPIERLVEGMQFQTQLINPLEQADLPLQLVAGHSFETDELEESSTQQSLVIGALNIFEKDESYEIEVQVPGYLEDEVSLEMTDDILTISGQKQNEVSNHQNIIRREWQTSDFSRQIRFTNPVNDGQIEAKMRNGTLLITVPKIKLSKSKTTKIVVKKN